MSERLKFQGRLLEKEQDARRLKLSIEGLRDAIRDQLDPFCPVEHLTADRVVELAVDLNSRHIDYAGLLAEIAAIKKALGR